MKNPTTEAAREFLAAADEGPEAVAALMNHLGALHEGGYAYAFGAAKQVIRQLLAVIDDRAAHAAEFEQMMRRAHGDAPVCPRPPLKLVIHRP